MGSSTAGLKTADIREYCLKHLKALASEDKELSNVFVNRIQFIMLDDNSPATYEPAFKYPSDVIAMVLGTPYAQLDDEEFKLEL